MMAALHCSGPWTERYENLRRHVLDHPQQLGGAPLGLGLVQHQGVVGWMRAWAPALPVATAGQTPVPSLPGPVWQQQLTQLLAQMTLAHLPTPANL